MKAIKKKSYIWTKMVFWKNFVVILVKKKKKRQRKFGGAQSIQYSLVDSENAMPFPVE